MSHWRTRGACVDFPALSLRHLTTTPVVNLTSWDARIDAIQRQIRVLDRRNILSDRLNMLVAHEVLERELYQERPQRYEYRLTAKGLDLYPVLLTIMDWGAKHIGGEAMTLQHKHCGAVAMPHLACPECGEKVVAREMRAVRDEALPKTPAATA